MNALNPVLPDELSKEAEEKLWKEFNARKRQVLHERAEAVTAACPALQRLCDVMQCRSGQPYKVRALLFSLWNGKPVALNESLGLDWEIKKDLVKVILAFGDDAFFYKAMEEQLRVAGLFDWFREERDGAREVRDRLKVAMNYPRGSEAQVRCFEEIYQDLKGES